MKTVSVVLTQALTLLSPIVGVTLIACTSLLILLLLLIVAFSPGGTQRLVDLVREIQQISHCERTSVKRDRRQSPEGQE